MSGVGGATESRPRSRRALLLGAASSLGALAAGALARPQLTRAEGQAVVVGGDYFDATTTTTIANLSGNNTPVLQLSQALGSGDGLFALSRFGNGVHAFSNDHNGVFGESAGTDRAGVLAQANSSRTLALRTFGRLELGGVSGTATIPAGKTSVVIVPDTIVTLKSFVLLTPRANIGTRALWYTTDPPHDKVTIHMSSARPVGTKVAWLLIG
jgi:hypothetical protein